LAGRTVKMKIWDLYYFCKCTYFYDRYFWKRKKF